MKICAECREPWPAECICPDDDDEDGAQPEDDCEGSAA